MIGDGDIQALLQQLENHITQKIGAQVVQLVRELEASIDKRVGDAIAARTYLPPLPLAAASRDPGPFMPYSTCSTADFLHPRYAQICAMFGQPPIYRRKIWEWVSSSTNSSRPGC